jgi:hypothetical protein
MRKPLSLCYCDGRGFFMRATGPVQPLGRRFLPVSETRLLREAGFLSIPPALLRD